MRHDRIFPSALLVAVKASLNIGDHRNTQGWIDAHAVAHDLLTRFPHTDPALVDMAVMERLMEDPLHCLA